jgi:geranylgeranyl diphosphate synthase type I
VIISTPPVLGRARDEAGPAMRAAVAKLLPELHGPVQYHFGWADVDGTPVAGGGGKGVRPALAILSAEAAGAPAAAGVPGAVALELVHNFSLLHDDVIDNDRERRHRPTVWALFGVGDAIIAGDALLTLALEVLFEAEAPGGARAAAALTRATSAMIAGQVLDMTFETRDAVSLDECITMECGKTGALLACAASIGALMAGGDDRLVDALAAYGRHLGLAFQAIDDVLGIWGAPAVTGKPAWSDLRQHKKALPLVFAWEQATGSERRELRDLLSNGTPTEPAMARAATIIEARGGRECAESFAARELDAAFRALGAADLDRGVRAELVELAHFVVERQS